jgi:hypothetical protein
MAAKHIILLLAFVLSACTGSSEYLAVDSNRAGANISGYTGANGCVDAGSPAPCILYTDALSGPIAGGENNKGAYLSIYGKNFGDSGNLGGATRVYIGGVEVDNYRELVPSAVYTKFGIQKLTVQVGAIGSPTLGTPLAIKVCRSVTTVCSNTNHTFIPNDGRVLFVSLTGNDSTADPDDITHPYRHLQTADTNRYSIGAYADIQAGDHIVIRGGNWNDIAFEDAWLRFRDPHARGDSTHWIHFTAYPGETVTYTTPANAKGGFQGAGSSYAGTTGEYISMSNLHMVVNGDASNDAAPFNQQSGTGPWRVVNNEIGPWPALDDARAGGYSGGGSGTKLLGNYIHDIRRICDTTNAGTAEFNSASCPANVGNGETLLNHGMYIDGGADGTEIGYNIILNVLEGNLIQTFDSLGEDGVLNTLIHHNWLENAGKHGLNISNGTGEGLIVFNNVIIGAKNAGIRLNIAYTPISGGIAYNTLYKNDYIGNQAGQIATTYNTSVTGSLLITDNIVHTNNKTNTVFYSANSNDGFLSWGKNIYFNGSLNPVNGTGTVLVTDPLLENPAANNFTLLENSPAIDAAAPVTGVTILDDFLTNPRPNGTVTDIGAYEFIHL